MKKIIISSELGNYIFFLAEGHIMHFEQNWRELVPDTEMEKHQSDDSHKQKQMKPFPVKTLQASKRDGSRKSIKNAMCCHVRLLLALIDPSESGTVMEP